MARLICFASLILGFHFASAAPSPVALRVIVSEYDGVRVATHNQYKMGDSKPAAAMNSQVLNRLVYLQKSTPYICSTESELNSNGDMAISSIDCYREDSLPASDRW
jgi:hypothetical protein